MTASVRVPAPADALCADADDVDTNPSFNPSANPCFSDIIAARLSRRGLFWLGLGTAGAAMLQACGGGGVEGFHGLPAAVAARDAAVIPGVMPAPQAEPAPASALVADADAAAEARPPEPLRLGFAAVDKSVDDRVSVPLGYTASVLYRLGDPIAAGVAAYANDGTDDAATFDRRAGDHHDGMTFFGMNASGQWDPVHATRGLLVMNHESTTAIFLHPKGQTPPGGNGRPVDEVLREFYVYGVSVIEVSKSGHAWRYKQDSAFNRRVHTLTEIGMSGPAARTDYLKTRYSTDGSKTRGTINNCANGTTPWGTYLTCEENWKDYFRRVALSDNGNRTSNERASFARYGVEGSGSHRWATVTPDTPDNRYGRWNTEVTRAARPVGATGPSAAPGLSAVDDYRNVANTYGWVVEIDPFNPNSMPKKRTALGRFGHEGACLGPVVVGKPLVWYMGDDSQNEYLYKFVSTKAWDAADVGGGTAAGDKYMDDGKLYVAKFKADGSGDWLELKLGVNGITAANANYAFADAADVLINTRLAADSAGATKMDRPEWTAVNPKNGEVYLTLTNNSARTISGANNTVGTDAANPRYYNDPKGATAQKGNPNGHVIRFADTGGNPAAVTFKWDVYLFGARSTASADINVSNLGADNDFSSPDGMWFSQAAPGLLWLETDDGKYTDVTNCMLLAALPGTVGDGAAKTITNMDGATTATQATFVGKAPGTDGLRRFLVGPVDCEITGIAESGDGRALFVNIQHPGENSKTIGDPNTFLSHWPDGAKSRPRSATVVITRNDGGLIGL